MADQEALQEAIQRARQLAAKISQNTPVKRPASEIDGPVKVTLAYEKPAAIDKDKDKEYDRNRDRRDYNDRDRDLDRERDSERAARDSDRSRDVERDRDQNRGQERSRDREKDRERENDRYSISTTNNNYSNPNDERIEITIPHTVIGLVIGKGGANIKRIQNESGATVRVNPNTVDEKGNKVCTITGTREAVQEAHKQVSSIIDNSANNKRPRTQSNAPRRVEPQRSDTQRLDPQRQDPQRSEPQRLDQQRPDVSAAWAAYLAQYHTMMGASSSQLQMPHVNAQQPLQQTPQQQPLPQQPLPPQQQPQQQTLPTNQAVQPQQDYTDQWIEFYLMNGRPDYAEQIIEMKKQQTQKQQQQQQSQQPQSLHIQGVMADKTQQ